MKRPEVDIPADVMTCCDKPSVVVMDHTNWSIGMSGRYENVGIRVNRVCTKCYTHWAGRPGRIRKYRRTEWDGLFIADAANELRERKTNAVRRVYEASVRVIEADRKYSAETDESKYSEVSQELGDAELSLRRETEDAMALMLK